VTTLNLFERQALLDVKPTELRPYQAKAIQALRDAVRAGKKRILLVAPVAAGKMVIIASIVRTSSVPAIFVAHRKELIDGCVHQLARLGIHNVGVMRGDDDRTDPDAATQICSIQTLARRKKPHAGIVLIDEAHLALSDSYQDLVDSYPDAIIIGFTATPTRLDGRPLGNTFEHMIVVATYQELIKNGFIVAPECYSTPHAPDLSKIRIIGGDYEEGALGELMREQSLVGNILSHWLKLARLYPKPGGGIGTIEGPRRRTLIFATSIQHSLDICERFAKEGIRIAHVDGTTPEGERDRIVRAIGDGELEVVSNCNLFLEGTDIPSVKCIVHARPTQSLVLWRQSTGRALRPWHPGCPLGCMEHPSLPPMVLDHASNISRHGFPHEDLQWSLTEKSRRLEKKTPIKICKTCYAYVPASRMLCPYCGTELAPEPSDAGPPAETDDQLVRKTPEDAKLDYYNAQVAIARKRGHKPGYAAAKYREKFSAWPPWAWSEATKSSFASDPEWHANMETKQERIAKKKAADEAKEAAAAEVNDAQELVEEDPIQEEEMEGSSPFADWVESVLGENK
jgi:DNA repair protein RadD